jgi:glycosyltransferase involved in cell wall biosynthesis
VSSVSVVIPCYNYGCFLAEAVSSALDDQPGVDVRVLIIDDASPDGSADVARQIAASEPRVEVKVNASNRGVNATCTEGVLEWADGDYTVVLSADDRLTPGALRRAADLMDAHRNVGLVYGHPITFQHGRPPAPARTSVRGWSVWPGHWWLERRFRDGTSSITSPELVARTSVRQRLGEYDRRLPHSADFEMGLELAALADVGYIRGADQAYYRVHGQNMTKSRTMLVDLQQRRLAYEVLLERCGDVLPNVPALSEVVHRKLSWEALWYVARAYDRGRTREAPIEGLITFALDCWPQVTTLPVYRGLQLRQLIGPTFMPYLQPFVLSAVARKAQSWWWWQSWARRGL